jgi:hypothetical protein
MGYAADYFACRAGDVDQVWGDCEEQERGSEAGDSSVLDLLGPLIDGCLNSKLLFAP